MDAGNTVILMGNLHLDSLKDPSGFQLHIFAAMSATGLIKASFWARVGTRKKVEKLSFQGSGDHKPRATRVHVRWSGKYVGCARHVQAND